MGEHNVQTNSELITNLRNSAKQSVDIVENTLKKKELNNEDMQLIEHLPVIVQQCATRISADLEDLMRANLEYRGGWPASARDLLSPQAKSIVDPYVANRQKQIDARRPSWP